MLVLRRKRGESLVFGRQIRLTILETARSRVSLGISAPAHIPVLRAELIDEGNAGMRRLTIVKVESVKRIGNVIILGVGDDETVEIRNASEFLAIVRNLYEESAEDAR